MARAERSRSRRARACQLQRQGQAANCADSGPRLNGQAGCRIQAANSFGGGERSVGENWQNPVVKSAAEFWVKQNPQSCLRAVFFFFTQLFAAFFTHRFAGVRAAGRSGDPTPPPANLGISANVRIRTAVRNGLLEAAVGRRCMRGAGKMCAFILYFLCIAMTYVSPVLHPGMEVAGGMGRRGSRGGGGGGRRAVGGRRVAGRLRHRVVRAGCGYLCGAAGWAGGWGVVGRGGRAAGGGRAGGCEGGRQRCLLDAVVCSLGGRAPLHLVLFFTQSHRQRCIFLCS